jgi:epoxide hydrolase-like predicted phosphatase
MGDRAPMSQAARLRHDMVEAVRGLHEVMPTALLTNNVREWRDGWHNVFDVDQLFDVVVDSSEVGARKPEPEIYHATRERLGVDHEAIFFIDDIGQNLKAARSLGWQTFLFDEPEAAVAVIEEIRRAHQKTAKRGRT